MRSGFFNKKMIHKKKQQSEQNTSVAKPLFLHFAIVCLLAGVLVCVVAVLCYGAVKIIGGNDHAYIELPGELTKKDAAIVPGTAVQDGYLSAKALERLNAALYLYENDLAEQIIVSGTQEEAELMACWLLMHKVPAQDIAADGKGYDTHETIMRIGAWQQGKSYWLCSQELYADRARFLMKTADMEGKVLCVDTMYYNGAGKQSVREFFAATKAAYEAVWYRGKPKQKVHADDFAMRWEAPEEDPHAITAAEMEMPEDCVVKDIAPEDGYDAEAAIAYAMDYALSHNPEYPLFENNCTNFVSQCLVAGGIQMSGDGKISKKRKYSISEGHKKWYSKHMISEKTGRRHYATTQNFINTDAFLVYFTEQLGYGYSTYENTYDGQAECLKDMASGDVLILYDSEGAVAHIGLITGIGQWNAYYCSNTSDRRNISVFGVGSKYPEIGILHMSDTE